MVSSAWISCSLNHMPGSSWRAPAGAPVVEAVAVVEGVRRWARAAGRTRYCRSRLSVAGETATPRPQRHEAHAAAAAQQHPRSCRSVQCGPSGFLCTFADRVAHAMSHRAEHCPAYRSPRRQPEEPPMTTAFVTTLTTHDQIGFRAGLGRPPRHPARRPHGEGALAAAGRSAPARQPSASHPCCPRHVRKWLQLRLHRLATRPQRGAAAGRPTTCSRSRRATARSRAWRCPPPRWKPATPRSTGCATMPATPPATWR